MKFLRKLGVAVVAVALTAGPTAPTASAGAATSDRQRAHQPTLQASRTAVLSGKRLVLAGRVRPVANAGVVVLQKRAGDAKKWSVEARLKVSKRGRYVYTDNPRAMGVRHYRVVAPRVGNVKAATSKPVTVTVYRWLTLAKGPFLVSEGTGPGADDINGRRYSGILGSTYGWTEGSYAWNLDRTCLRVRARFANSDSSAQPAIANISLVADGVSVYAKSFALTKSDVRTIGVRGVFRLSFDWTSTDPDGTPEGENAASPMMAEPEALCASTPRVREP